ncbi:hypothetical protein ABZP36_000371 [Zizania latifolia]
MEAAAEVGTGGGGVRGRDGAKKAAACNMEALRTYLAENKCDRAKCQAHIDAFRSSCSVNPPPPRPPHRS